MNYILKNDLSSIKKILLYILLFYFLPIIIYRIILILSSVSITPNLLENIFSHNIYFNKTHWPLILIFIINISIYMMLIYRLIINDVEFEKSNIFLRLETDKWIKYKNISLIIFIFLYSLVRFIFISCITKFSINGIYIVFYQSIFLVFISNIFLISYTLFSKKEVVFFILFILSLLLKINIIILIGLVIISELIILKLLKVKRTFLLERGL